MTRREVSEKVFTYIKENGFVPYDIYYGDCYFVFSKGEDGVVHFRIKGLHGWKFAMWINTNEEELKNDDGKDYAALQFFCQHEQNIDKFKPSRSYFCEKYLLQDVEVTEPLFYNIGDMLKQIKYHPLFSFAQDSGYDKYVSTRSCLLNYLMIRYYNITYVIREWFEQIPLYCWTKFKIALCRNCKIVKSIKIIDHNTDGFRCSPRYDCRITFNRLYSDKQQDEAECKWLNIWFRKLRWHHIGIGLYREGLCNENGNMICYTYVSN